MPSVPHRTGNPETQVRRRRPYESTAAPGEVVVTDLRRSGWSWGWDTLAREFAGLLHQTGIGVYFTYATYTDNRKESPYRGSSYTGVEALADFSGESAEDIRTINKLLTALALARFETNTVYIPGKDGRRATRNRLHCFLLDRDPHLTPDDVLSVLRLALTDTKVYRYIRHLFRPTFRPIDRANDATGTPRENPNSWYRILPVIKRCSEWRELSVRADKDYVAVRERNLHGVEAAARRHAERNADLETILRGTEDGDSTILPNWEDASSLPISDPASPSVLPATEEDRPTRVPDTDENHDQEFHNQGKPEENTQNDLTTTTTREQVFEQPDVPVNAKDAELISSLADVFALFGQANRRPASTVEQELLRELVNDFDGPAQARQHDGSGTTWVMAAIVEAVDAGSNFVSPKRVRTICERWARDGFRSSRGSRGQPPDARDRQPWPDVPDIAMPNGQKSRTVWRRVIGITRGSLNADTLIRFLEPCFISSYDGWRSEVEVTVPDEHTGDKLDSTFRVPVERALATIFGRTVRFRCVVKDAEIGSDELAVREEDRREDATTNEAAPPSDNGGIHLEEFAAPEEQWRDPHVDVQASGVQTGLELSMTTTVGADKEINDVDCVFLNVVVPESILNESPRYTNREAWQLTLQECDELISPLRRYLFATQATLADWEDDTLLVVGANHFVTDQLNASSHFLGSALARLLRRIEISLRCVVVSAYRERLLAE